MRKSTRARNLGAAAALALVAALLTAIAFGAILVAGWRGFGPSGTGPLAFVNAGRVVVLDDLADQHAPRHDLGPVPGTTGCCWLSWSPDGRRLLVNSDSVIDIVNADGSGTKTIVRDARIEGAAVWSPTGNAIVASMAVNNILQLVAIDPTTGRQTQLTHEKDYARSPSFSPDGRQIAFSAETPSTKDGLFVINADGSGQRLVATLEMTNATLDPQHGWAPDGSRIAVTVAAKTFAQGAVSLTSVVTVATGSSRPVSIPPRTFARDAAWSPLGDRVAFYSLSADRSTTDVWLVDADGQGATKVATDVGFFLWSPDGKRLLLAREAVNGVFGRVTTIAIDGTDERTVAVQGVLSGAAWGAPR